MKSLDRKKLALGNWVRVTWDDAVGSDEGWVEAKDHTTQTASCITVGKIIRKDKKQVVLAQSAGADDEQVGNIWAVPLGMITAVDLWK